MTIPTETKKTYPTTQGKIIQLDYDFITSLTGACMYCLTDAQVQMILSVVDYYGWATRWYSSDGIIDFNTIENLKGGLVETLMNACCDDDLEVLKRITPNGHWQTSIDDGETWQDAPTQDPRRGVVLAPPFPAPEGDSPMCEWASSVKEVVKTQFIDNMEDTATLRDILAALAGLLALVFGLVPIAQIFIGLTAIPAVIFSIGVEAAKEAMTEDVWHRFLCNIYCHMDGGGLGDQSQVDGIYSQIATDETGIAVTILQGIVALFGVQGMSNAANMGFSIESDDCSDCCPSGCALENWEGNFTGNILDITGDDVTIEGIWDGTRYIIGGTTNSPDLCCHLAIENVVGGITTPFGYIVCGLAIDGANITFPLGNPDECNYFFAISGSPFTVILHFTA